MQTIKFLFGLALGLAIGWGVGSLLTPQSGEETRGTIRERIEKIIDEGRSAAEQRLVDKRPQCLYRTFRYFFGCLTRKAATKNGQGLEYLLLPLRQ